jgi:hypothetical protein
LAQLVESIELLIVVIVALVYIWALPESSKAHPRLYVTAEPP